MIKTAEDRSKVLTFSAENIIESLSYTVLNPQKILFRLSPGSPACAMRTVSERYICGQAHNELIISCFPELSLDKICQQMGENPA